MEMFMRLGNLIFLCLSLSIIIAVCNAQDSESGQSALRPNNNNDDDEKMQKQQESIEALMKEVGDMGMLLDNYRRVIVNGITETSNDMCSFIESVSRLDDKSTENLPNNGNEMAVNIYKQYFRDINDAVLKTQLFAVLENHIDDCYNIDARQILPKQADKRDKSQMQKIRFHSWGGKRNRGSPKIVIRTPFHSWGGKRSDADMNNDNSV